MTKTNKTIGTCQECFRAYCLNGALLVNHGFKRPGDGYLLGRCGGVDQEAFELSCEHTKKIAQHVKDVELPRLHAKQLTIQEATSFTVEAKKWTGKGKTGYEPITVVLTVENKYDRATGKDFDSHKRSALFQIEQQIACTKSYLKDLEKSIAGWVYSPEKIKVEKKVVKAPTLHERRKQGYGALCLSQRKGLCYAAPGVQPTCPKCLQLKAKWALIAAQLGTEK